MNNDMLISFGGAVKALGAGAFEGPLVRFADATDADITQDFFKAATDFWLEIPDDGSVRIPLIYHHGFDKVLKANRLGDGFVDVSRTEAGLWMKGQLNMADRYEAAIYAMIEEGKIGASSGSAPHLVQRQMEGKSYWVKSWPLVEASLTPTPMDPKIRVMPLKAWMDEQKAAVKSTSPQSLTIAAFRRLHDDLFMDVCDTLGLYKADDDELDVEAATAELATEFDEFRDTAIALVTAIMNGVSSITADAASGAMKALAGRSADDISTERDFESLLREAGFSRSQAVAITAHGYKALTTSQRDAATPKADPEAVKAALIDYHVQQARALGAV